MTTHRVWAKDTRIDIAIAILKELIRARYPEVEFGVFHGEDPEGVYLRAVVDLDDPDEVMDLVIDLLYEIEVEQQLPVYVLPVPSPGRVAAHLRSRSG